jgi:hypothetical protein
MAGTSGKVALVNGTTALTGTCPTGVVDLVGYGSANCFEGAAATGSLSNTTSAQRAGGGCSEVNDNSTDFTVTGPDPQNGGSTALVCTPCGTINETNDASEADFCNVQFPTSLSLSASAPSGNVYGRVFETGVTDVAGAPAGVAAELGVGPANVNPTTQSGYTYVPAAFNVQVGNDDEFVSTFTAPATPGDYRYVYRFSLDGQSWTYCDLDGAGSNPSLSFSVSQLPVLTVIP